MEGWMPSEMYFSIALVSGRDQGYIWPLEGAVPAKRLMAQSRGQFGGSLEAHGLLNTFARSL